MARTRITFSNDTDRPHVVHLGATVAWYVYRRDADKGLYLQRAVGAVLGPETLIAAPVDRVDMLVDPDGLRAWIYFTCDGALRCIEVTTLTETPSTQVFQRSPGWHERISTRALGGAGIASAMGFTDLLTSAFRVDDGPVEVYPPLISLLDVGSPTQALLVIEPSTILFGVIGKFRVFWQSDYDGAGWAWYSDVPLPAGSPQVSLLVPRATSPTVNEWVVTAVRFHYPEESAWSNIVRDSTLGEAVITQGLGGAGLGHSYGLVDKSPIKISVPTENITLRALGGAGLGHAYGLVDKSPLKVNVPTENIDLHALGGAGLGHRWVINGTEIITP